jgi:transcriptional regulator with PAS, ATPase and Fis domain
MAESTARAKRQNAKQLRGQVVELSKQLEMADLVFNHIYSGACVTDAKGFITHFNRPYGEFLGVDPAKQIGKHVTEVVENSRMHIVAQTGKPEINVSHEIKGQNMVVQRIPIFKDSELIGVFGHVIFKDVRDVSRLAQRLSLLESKVQYYEEELNTLRSTRYTMDSIKGPSPALKALKKEALRAASNQLPVLISGESGTGKELFAQGIHQASPRRLRPFVRLNCAAIPRDLFESELFGYAKGAFTGAHSQGKPGKFELANGGTIFLDEIGELPLAMQPKLLRVLEEKEFERIGGTKIIKTDFKLIAASNRNLEELMAEGRFRQDLYYRLNVIPIRIPPLRVRTQDIVPIARHLLDKINEETNLQYSLSPQAEKVLESHDWPGNVRELSNVLERALSGLEGYVIGADDLAIYLRKAAPKIMRGQDLDLKKRLGQAEKEAIQEALALSGNNKSQAANRLGIHRTHLYKKMQKHGLAV